MATSRMRIAFAGVTCFVVGAAFHAPACADPLLAGFQDPPSSARPRTWWHWLNGNVTRDGIEKDLDWLASVGVGGVQNFDASLGTPQIVEKRLEFMDSGWKDAFGFAVAKADRLGLEFTIAASPGWSETGGPWVAPADGMKKLVWSEMRVAGGTPFEGRLPAPPHTTGPFQDVAFFDPLAGTVGGDAPPPPVYYGDVAVLAYPVAAQPLPAPVAESGRGEPLQAALLIDDAFATVAELSKGDGTQPPAVVYTWPVPVTVRSATLFLPHVATPFGEPPYLPRLEAESASGWIEVSRLPLTEVPTTVSFEAVTARRFRLVFAPNTDASPLGLGEAAPGAVFVNIFATPESPNIEIAQWRLSREARINEAEVKAGFALVPDYYALPVGPARADGAVQPSQVVDLGDRVNDDGTLEWTPPAGSDWRILRLGYSLIGTTNHPASAEATGLEADKYDAQAVRRYLEHYLAMYRDATGLALMGSRGLQALLTDSIEVGASNWTPGLRAKFKRLRGYDPTPWLPALTGALIATPAQSEAFLYDFRRTLADLLASEHYGTVAAVAREHGLRVYGEALENGRPVLGDDIAMRAHTSVPMAALWTAPRPTLLGDMKGAASVAHVYGQNLVAAESFTAAFSPWAFAPADLKPLADLEFAYGVNRPVIHTSVHQPSTDKVPGLSLAIFGQYFTRHETWAPLARPWIDYMARSSFLLQQGRNVADVAYFYGEDAPITAQFLKAPPDDLPVRHAYDFVNPDVLANELNVEHGELVAKSGARYRVLYLGGTSERMTLPTMRRIAALAEHGATVVGGRPRSSPSLADDPDAFAKLAGRLWRGGETTRVGKGRVVDSDDVESALAKLDVVPDFEYAKPESDSEVLFIHRKLADGDAYFISNRRDRQESFEARFRVTGKRPQIWRAIDASVAPVSYRIEGAQTVVPLTMGAQDAFFVVFREPATATAQTVAPKVLSAVATLDGPWRVAFQSGRGAPPSTELAVLRPLNESEDPGIRYFSGIATYRSAFALPASVRPGQPLTIDLGRVGDVAEVRVNGKSAGIAWWPPYRAEIGTLVTAGENQLEIRVANLWVNRLIGDQQPGAEKIAFVAAPTYLPDAPLRPSGLMGPVRLLTPN